MSRSGFSFNNFGIVATGRHFAKLDVVDVSPASFNNDAVVTVDLSSGISDYAQPGTGAVRTRVGWRKTGFTINYPWEVRLDQMVWIVQ